jgi:hypothetical protein
MPGIGERKDLTMMLESGIGEQRTFSGIGEPTLIKM